MPYISVVPAIRTPYGVDVFDYRIGDSADIHPGDLIRVPFRRNPIPALVVSKSQTSDFASRAVTLENPTPLLRFSATIIPLLDQASRRSFSSRPTILQSWIRDVPKRARGETSAPRFQFGHLHPPVDITELVTNRNEQILNAARSAHGRVLILTPWKNRADALAAQLSCPVLHADIPTTSAWSNLSSFVQTTQSMIVSTRLGAWLSSMADLIIIDEPENDDFKQDELAPRLDARWIIETANLTRPHLSIMRIGTTPMLETGDAPTIPTIDLPLSTEPWSLGSRSSIEGLSGNAVEAIQNAIEADRPVLILHPITGERGRIVCRDCGWNATCDACGFSLTRETNDARCRRCGRRQEIPPACPSCGGTDLNKSRIGRTRLAEHVRVAFGDRVTVVDLADWHRSRLARNTFVVVTDLSMIGGVTEDIRRRERLLIAWRRLAAAIASMEGSLLVQGPELLLSQATTWLTANGVRETWNAEIRDRATFGYPPTSQLIKLLFTGSENNATSLANEVQKTLPSGWTLRGPFPVANRSKTRDLRFAMHLLPPKDANEETLRKILEPFAKLVIIDLDPIAFFS